MRAVKPLDSNMVYRRPPGANDVLDLHCTRVRPGVISTQWRLEGEEIAYFVAGGDIELVLWHEPIPPISLAAKAPFCPECIVEMEMQWSERDLQQAGVGGSLILPAHWHFRCPSCKRWA